MAIRCRPNGIDDGDGGERVGAIAPACMTTPSQDALQELIDVVAQLRDPDTGCPWDLEQTHATLVPYVLEEAHEVADAIRHGDDSQLKEELGDLLLQVVLHAPIAREQRRFDLDAIARAISAKLIRRHPHVFGDDEASDSEAVTAAGKRSKRLNGLSDSAPPAPQRPTGREGPRHASPGWSHDHLKKGGQSRL